MAESGGIRAGKAFVELSIQDKVSRQFDAIAARLKATGENITNIGKQSIIAGAAITAPLIVAAQQFAAMGSDVNDFAARTGISVGAAQALGYAAAQTGAAIEDVETATKKMSKAIFEAATGSKTAKESLAALNLSVEDLKGLKPEEQFELIASRLAGVNDPAARTALAMELFGKSGTKLLPMFSELGDLTARYKELGAAFDPEDVAAADAFGDALDDVAVQARAVLFNIGAAVASAIMPFGAVVTRTLRSVIQWTRENRALFVTLLAVGVGLVVLGTSLVALGLTLKVIGFAIGGIVPVAMIVAKVIAAIVSPIGLVVVALGVLAAYLLATTESGAQLLAWLGGKFNTLAETARIAFGGIADALAAGDIALAAQILWAGLKLAWTQGTQELQGKWSEFKAWMVSTSVETFYSVLSAWAIAQASLEKLWVNAKHIFVSLWAAAVAEVSNLFDELESNERAKEKERIRRQLKRTDLAAPVREMLERQLADVDRHGDQVRNARDKQDQDKAAERERQLAERIKAIDADRDRKLAENVDAERNLTAAAAEKSRQEIADIEQHKQDLERQLAELRARAQQQREAKGDDGGFLPPGVRKRIEDLQDILERLNAEGEEGPGITARGTFNAAAVQGLAGGTTQFARIAKAAEATQQSSANTEKHTKKIADKPTAKHG